MNYSIQNKDQRVKDFIQKQYNSNEFAGIQYVVISSSSNIFNYSTGVADIKTGRKLKKNSTMMIYSMTKTITAAAILQLVDEKKLSLDDPVIRFLPYIPYGGQVTIRHLLSQISGIPNPIPLRWIHLINEDSNFDEDAELKKLLITYQKLDFQPGKKYAYSNISYWLLGKVIEKVTDSDYKEYVRKNIFQKLGLPSNEIDFIIPSMENHSKGYLKKLSFLNLFKFAVIDSKFFGEYENGWLRINDHYLNGSSFGGIVCSAQSISLFLQDQLRENSALFSKKTKELFFEQQKNNNGNLIEMTLGWHIDTINNTKYFFKEGGGGGFHSEMRIYPSQKIGTVVIANNTSFDVKSFLNKADREFFK